MIKKWNKRLPSDTPDDAEVIHAMQSEIDELRAEVIRLKAAYDKYSEAELLMKVSTK